MKAGPGTPEPCLPPLKSPAREGPHSWEWLQEGKSVSPEGPGLVSAVTKQPGKRDEDARRGDGRPSKFRVCYTVAPGRSMKRRFESTGVRRSQRRWLASACLAALAVAVPLACQTQTSVPVAPSAPAAGGEIIPSIFDPQARQIAAIPGAQVQRESDRLLVFFSGDELFESGTATLAPAGTSRLHDFAEAVRSLPDVRLAIRGYTDAQGSESFNLTLSEDRADSVRRYLVGEGIEPGHISAAGFGPQFPVASNDTPEGRRMNRRIEIELRPTTAANARLQSGAPEPR